MTSKSDAKVEAKVESKYETKAAKPNSTSLTKEAEAFFIKMRPFDINNDDRINLLLPLLKLEQFQQGEYVFCEGDPSEKVYFIFIGEFELVYAEKSVATFGPGRSFGEVGFVERDKRRAHFRAASKGSTIVLERQALLSDSVSRDLVFELFSYLGKRITSLISGIDFYSSLDVLLVQDGGCAPGYNTVTAFLTEYFELAGRRVFVAKTGFKSIVSGKDEDFCAITHDRALYDAINLVPRVHFASNLRNKRGAMFRTERYPEFKEKKLQEQAAKVLIERKVRTIVFIGGNGTFAGAKAMAQILPSSIQNFFIPVTIDSDIGGTECIGQHTAVEIGAEKIRCFIADSETHHRCYIIEMMGADGGYHALFSAIGAGAELAVLPQSKLDLDRVATLVQKRWHTVIVVAEGYGREERDKKGLKESASSFLYRQLLDTGKLDPKKKVVCEPFTRDIRGAAPNNNDVSLSQMMAKQLALMSTRHESRRMPTVLSGKTGSLHYDEIVTDNTVDPTHVMLADHLDTVV